MNTHRIYNLFCRFFKTCSVLIASPDSESHLSHVRQISTPSPPVPKSRQPADALVSELLVSSLPSPSFPTIYPTTPPLVPGISYSEMSLLQQSCPKVQNIRQSSALKVVSVPISGSPGLLCDVSAGIHRPLVPESMRRAVFNSVHQVSHPGKRASRSFVWEFLSKDVDLWAQSCLDCQRSKVQSHVKSPVHHIPVPGRRFSHIHVDLVGPLPQSNGFSLSSLIDQQDGWRQFLFTQLLQRIVQEPSYVLGYLCSEYHL